MNIKLSVIIPVYNVKNQVIRCLESLHKQTMQAIEFLVVDDGSTDGTTDVLINYLNKISDKRFKYFHKTNGGYSSAYNYALKRAKGTFVTVVESDDYLVSDSQALSYLCLQALQNQLDVLEYSYQTVKFDECGNINDTQIAFVNRHDSQVVSGIALYYQSIENNDFHSYLWHYMFRRQFLLDNNLHCDENIFGVPDLLLTTSVLLKAQRAKFINYILYNYMVRANSITNDPKYEKDRYKNYMHVINIINNMVNNTKMSLVYRTKINNYLIRTYLVTCLKIYAQNIMSVSRKNIINFIGNKKLSKKMNILFFIVTELPSKVRNMICKSVFDAYIIKKKLNK